MTPDHVAIATWYIETTRALAELKREVDEAKSLRVPDTEGKILQFATGQFGRSQRFNELVNTAEVASKDHLRNRVKARD